MTFWALDEIFVLGALVKDVEDGPAIAAGVFKDWHCDRRL